MKTNSVRLNFHHWCKAPSSAFSKKFQRRPQFFHVFGRAPSDLQHFRTVCEIFDF